MAHEQVFGEDEEVEPQDDHGDFVQKAVILGCDHLVKEDCMNQSMKYRGKIFQHFYFISFSLYKARPSAQWMTIAKMF